MVEGDFYANTGFIKILDNHTRYKGRSQSQDGYRETMKQKEIGKPWNRREQGNPAIEGNMETLEQK